MTLRLRLALGAALLAAVSAFAVAVIGYASTRQQVHSQIDQSLTSALNRFTDPDGRLVAALCQSAAPGQGGFGENRVDTGLLGGTPGISLQCLDANGTVLGTIGPFSGSGLHACSGTSNGTMTNGTMTNGIAKPQTRGTDDSMYRLAGLSTPSGYCIAASRSLDETSHELDSVRNRLLDVGAAVTAMGALLGLFAARRATRPIRHLTTTAENIAASGKLDIALEPGGSDEVGRLTNAFTTMIEALRHSRHQQQQLVQDAGHELRTPLTSIRTNIDTLARYRNLDAQVYERILTDAKGELQEMSALVDELVILSTEHLDDSAPENVDLSTVTHAVVNRWCRRSGREITVTGEGISVMGHAAQVTRALSNVLDNAIKFSPPESTVEVRLDGTMIEVHDHGPGVDEQEIDHIFARFYRATDARSLPGSGLGLAIVAQVMESHNGSVSVHNHPQGGAVFALDFAAKTRQTTKAR